MHPRKLFALPLAALAFTPFAMAQDVGQHPAVFAARSLPGVDANTFIVGHPASPRNRVTHANREHPAVTQWARAATPAIDSNLFLVQPPTPVLWTMGPRGDLPLAAAGTSAALASAAPLARR